MIGGVSNTVTVNDNATVNPLSSLTVTDLDRQELLISVTILNGRVRGDFTPASVAGWTRSTLGNNVPVGTTETTSFTVTVKDGSAVSATNSTTSVITTGVVPPFFPTMSATSIILDEDITTVVLPTVPSLKASSLRRMLKPR